MQVVHLSENSGLLHLSTVIATLSFKIPSGNGLFAKMNAGKFKAFFGGLRQSCWLKDGKSLL